MNLVEKRVQELVERAREQGVLGQKWDVSRIEQSGDTFVLDFRGPDEQGFSLQLKHRMAGVPACAVTANFSVTLLTQQSQNPQDETEDLKVLNDFLKVIDAGDREPVPDRHWWDLMVAGDLSAFLDGTSANFAEVKVTLNCNQSCVMCKTDPEVRNVLPDAPALEKLLPRLAEETDCLTLSGGEPTLDARLPEYVEMAHRAGFRIIEVQSNGVKLADYDYVKRLVDAGKGETSFLVSLHAHEAELSDRITQAPGTFEKTMQGLHNIEKAGAVLVLCYVIMTLNYRHTPAYVDFIAKEFGHSADILFTLAVPVHRVLDNRELLPRVSDFAPYLRKALGKCRARDGNDLRELHVKYRPRALVIGGSGLTMCAIPGFEHMHRERDSKAPRDTWHLLMKAEQCRECKWDDCCSGFWRRYAELYGTDEFIPVPKD
jgi:MoaA/NifB/PqqE/SkfB family radical SAM enzyme